MRYLKSSLAAVALFALVPLVRADTGLAMVCKDTTSRAGVRLSDSTATKCVTAAYAKPTASSMVASCTLDNCGTWTATDAQWRLFSTLPDTGRVLKCTANIAPNVNFVLGASANDPCPSTSKPTPWTLKPLLLDTTQYTVKLSWQAPTLNEDSSPLTDLRGYYVFKSTGTDLESGLALLPEGSRLQNIANAAQLTIDIPVNPDQKTYFGVTAYRCLDAGCVTKVESKLSTVVGIIKDSARPPTVALSCTPAAAIRSASVTCTWSSTGATSCMASNAWTGVKAISGSETKTITESAMFNLSCTGLGGTTSASAPVIINVAPNSVSSLIVQ